MKPSVQPASQANRVGLRTRGGLGCRSEVLLPEPCPQAQGLRKKGQMLPATLQPGEAFPVKDGQVSGARGQIFPYYKGHFRYFPGFMSQEPSLL